MRALGEFVLTYSRGVGVRMETWRRSTVERNAGGGGRYLELVAAAVVALEVLRRSEALEASVHHDADARAEGVGFLHLQRQHKHFRGETSAALDANAPNDKCW